MSSRERVILFAILLIAMLFLPLTLKAVTEDDTVTAHTAGLERSGPHGFSVGANGGIGCYTGCRYLWDGFGAYGTGNGEYYGSNAV